MYPNVKLQLWRLGMRQNRLAQVLAMDETNLSRIVNGFRKPAPEVKQKIAKALDCDPVWLFEECETQSWEWSQVERRLALADDSKDSF